MTRACSELRSWALRNWRIANKKAFNTIEKQGIGFMTWIKTLSPEENEELRKAVKAQRELYPIEYATPIHPAAGG